MSLSQLAALVSSPVLDEKTIAMKALVSLVEVAREKTAMSGEPE
jgi:hypothetical protein